ncbi:hypothetical protein M3Y94_00017100 [Aphelenchoides besseyi]|nr:hypothetical protein M3Y94_00017100 [Aphelenchoides besseyi]
MIRLISSPRTGFDDFNFLLNVDNQYFKVYKDVLAAKSEFFYRLFKKNAVINGYSIVGASWEAVEFMVKFLYESKNLKFSLLTEEQLTDVYQLSRRFEIPELRDLILKAVKWQLSMKDAPMALIFAVKQKDVKITKLIIDIVEQQGSKSDLLLSDAFFCLVKENTQLYIRVLEALRK